MATTATVSELWRYPVKSMGGESLRRADVGAGGLVGDRLWALRDERSGTITNAKRLPCLMRCSARYLAPPSSDPVAPPPPVAIALPDGRELRSDRPGVDEGLSAFVGHPVTLCARRPASDRAHYRAPRTTPEALRRELGVAPGERLPDLSMFPLKILHQLSRFATPPGTYFDAYPLHLVSTGSLAALRAAAPDVEFSSRRFRPNILVAHGASSTPAELGWCGGRVSSGDLVIRLEIPTVRCSMTMQPQPGLPADPRVLRTAAAAGRCVGVYASVERPGPLEVGQAIEVEVEAISRWRGGLRAVAVALKRCLLRAALARPRARV